MAEYLKVCRLRKKFTVLIVAFVYHISEIRPQILISCRWKSPSLVAKSTIGHDTETAPSNFYPHDLSTQDAYSQVFVTRHGGF
jgi:hypothetical protein